LTVKPQRSAVEFWKNNIRNYSEPSFFSSRHNWEKPNWYKLLVCHLQSIRIFFISVCCRFSPLNLSRMLQTLPFVFQTQFCSFSFTSCSFHVSFKLRNVDDEHDVIFREFRFVGNEISQPLKVRRKQHFLQLITEGNEYNKIEKCIWKINHQFNKLNLGPFKINKYIFYHFSEFVKSFVRIKSFFLFHPLTNETKHFNVMAPSLCPVKCSFLNQQIVQWYSIQTKSHKLNQSNKFDVLFLCTPFESLMLTSTPCSNNNLTISIWPLPDAKWSAVCIIQIINDYQFTNSAFQIVFDVTYSLYLSNQSETNKSSSNWISIKFHKYLMLHTAYIYQIN
jgi:hypothetical protein